MSTMTRPTASRRPSAKTRTYVLDTCVLLADPNALLKFDEHDVVIPLVVIEELDRKKTALDDVGRNARLALRAIEELRVQSGGGLRDALPLPTGGSVRIESNHVDVELPPYLDKAKADHRILCVAIGLQGTLVTKDAGLRIKGSQLGVEVEDYRGDTARTSEHDAGLVELDVDAAFLDLLHRDGKAVLDRDMVDLRPAGGALWPNACLVLKAGRSASGLGRVLDVDEDGVATVHRVAGHRAVFGMSPRDVRQTFAIDLLLDPDVPCVSLMGMAGTGKTFLALASGLEQVLEATAYRRLSVYRPLIAVGRQEIGYLPGDLDEKLAPWMAAVHDNLYALLRRADNGPAAAGRGAREHRQIQSTIDSLVDRGQLELAAITYLRGRSITDEFVVVDEAQNIELSALKVVLTRMATGSKVVFCGDLGQVDNPYISPYGGMAALIEKMKGSPLFGHITLTKGVRSPLAEHAASIF
ncbi:MAG TPA: PhoH family protein [Egicoccus sp.]|nr:PhoH family protein [Egicoccus sp.]HSK23368.1 PhoH family protein [Egicoccus sp.]